MSINKTAFIIDDSSFARRVNKKILEEIGYEILGEAQDHVAAITGLKDLKSKSTIPDLITLDIVMPDVTGDQLLPQVLEIFPETTVVMLTSVASTDTVKKCLSTGAKGYIVKPVSKEKIIDALEIINVKERLRHKPVSH